MSSIGNCANIDTTGIISFNNTNLFNNSGNITQHAVFVTGANQLITPVLPSAVSGTALRFSPSGGAYYAPVSNAGPNFSAYLPSNVTGVTGDNTAYNIINYTETFDSGGNFNPATGRFTCPASLSNGVFLFSLTAYFINLSSAFNQFALGVFGNVINDGMINSKVVDFMAPDGTYGNVLQLTANMIIEMAASDYIGATVTVNGSSKTVGLLANSTIFTGTYIGTY